MHFFQSSNEVLNLWSFNSENRFNSNIFYSSLNERPKDRAFVFLHVILHCRVFCVFQKHKLFPFFWQKSWFFCFHCWLSNLKCLTNCNSLAKQGMIEVSAEDYGSIIRYLKTFSHTNNMLSPSLVEYLSCKLTITRCYEYELYLSATSFNQFMEPFFTQKLSATFILFKD